MTPETFGERLRRSRDHRGISLQAIADETKIGRRLFSDLERGDCSRWPAGIYARAYVRSYARMIALEPDEVVAEFCELFPQFAASTDLDPEEVAAAASRLSGRGWFAQLRDLLHRADSRLDLFLGIERPD